MVHNLRMIAWQDEAYDWAIEFDETLKQLILSGDHDSIIHYQNLGKAARLDVVLNYAIAELLERSYNILKTGGRYATTFAQPPQEEAKRRGIRSFGVFTQPSVDHLTQVARLIDAGKLRVFVHRTFPIDEAQAALDYRQTETAPGKVVLTLQ